MYWYYKLILVLLVVIIIGFLAAPYLADMTFNNFSKNEEAIVTEEQSVVESTLNSNVRVVDSKLDKQIQMIGKLLEEERYVEVLENTYLLLDDPLLEKFTEEWYRLADFAGKANIVIAFSNIPYEIKEKYTVVSGDSLARIAKRKTTVSAIARANNISGNIIYPDQILRFLSGPWRLEAYKSKYILIAYHNNKFFKYYKVGIGMHNRTPVGEFTIYDKIINPTYWNKGREIPFGDPDNPLGTRWMAVRDKKQPELKGYGIHGTKEPSSIGKSSSQGCLRMLNEEVEELFDLLPYRVKLFIKE